MISNYEFIKTQAFEVSWAIFRCTELFTQSKLRAEVEAAAVELIADYGVLTQAMEDEFPRIEKLTSLIRLAESVGQIASVNANVLYRELDNLAKAIQLEVVQRRDKKNIATSLEQMFTNSAYAKNLQQGSSNSAVVIPADAGTQSPSSMNQFGSIESLLSAAVQSSQPIDRGVNSSAASNTNPLRQYMQPAQEVRQSADQTRIVIPANAGIQSPADSAMTSPVIPANAGIQSAFVRQAQSSTVGSWQNVILQKVKDLNQTTTKELTASFPEISERTIRFYLQKLVDNGSIDRVGSTGPGAAYRAKM